MDEKEHHVLIIDQSGGFYEWVILDTSYRNSYFVLVGGQAEPREELRKRNWNNAYTYIRGDLREFSTIDAIARLMAMCNPPLERFDDVIVQQPDGSLVVV